MPNSEYDANSLDSRLTEIITTLRHHVEDTKQYRKTKDIKDAVIERRVATLEGDKKKLMGVAVGAGIGSGSLFAGLSKLFSGQ